MSERRYDLVGYVHGYALRRLLIEMKYAELRVSPSRSEDEFCSRFHRSRPRTTGKRLAANWELKPAQADALEIGMLSITSNMPAAAVIPCLKNDKL